MSKVSIFPDPSDKYRIALSSAMPTTPFPGLMVYQSDLERTVVWNGDIWMPISTDREEQVLYEGINYAVPCWDDTTPNEILFATPVVVTGIHAYGISGETCRLTMTTYTTDNTDRVVLLDLVPWRSYTTLEVQLYLPTDNLQAGAVLDSISGFSPRLDTGYFHLTVKGFIP